MVLTSVAPTPSWSDRFRAALRGDESLAWVFWSYYVVVGFVIAFIYVFAQLALISISGSDILQFAGTPTGQAFRLISDLVALGYFCIAFVLFVRCISNVSWRGWQYVAMLFVLGVSTEVVERARDIASAILG